jgi:uncharacterized protein (TIGR03435 family)
MGRLKICPLARLGSVLRAKFFEILETNLGIVVLTNLQEAGVYVMTACSSNAPCLKPAQKDGGGGGRPGGFYFGGTHMKTIASFFESALNKPVMDETGLTGLWKVDFKWEMSESELLSQRLDPRFQAMMEKDADKILSGHLPEELQNAISTNDLALLKAELARPDERQFQPDPARVIRAAREQLGLELKLTNRKMPALLVQATR